MASSWGSVRLRVEAHSACTPECEAMSGASSRRATSQNPASLRWLRSTATPSSAQRRTRRRPAAVSPGPVSGEAGKGNGTPGADAFGRLHTGPNDRSPPPDPSPSAPRAGVSPGPVSGEAGKANGTPWANAFGRLHTGPIDRSPAAYQSSSASRSGSIASAPSWCRTAASTPSARAASRSAISRTRRTWPSRSRPSSRPAASVVAAAAISRPIGAASSISMRPSPSKSMCSAPGVGVNIAKMPPARPPSRARGRSRWPPSRPVAKSAASSRVSASLCPSKTGITARGAALSGVALVQRREVAGVLLADDVALDLQRRGQLAGLLRQVVVEDEEALDLLDLRVLLVCAVELGLDELTHLRVLGERGRARVVDALLLRPRDDLLLVERHEHHRVRAAVAVHDRLRDPPGLLHVVLEVGGRQVLAAGGDDDVLLPSGDEDVAVLVDARDVAGVQPAVDDRAEAGVVVAVVALEDVRPLEQELAVLADPALDAGQQLADRAEAVLRERRVRRDGRRLGHAVALEHRHAAAVEELEDLLGDRRRAGDRVLQPPAEDRAHVLEELLVGLLERLLELGRHRLAVDLHVSDLHAELRGRLRALLRLGRLGGHHERVDLLEDPGHAREVRRLDLLQLGDDLVRIAAPVRDRVADIEREQLDEEREGVGERQEEVDLLLALQHAERLAQVERPPVVAVREDAALRRPGRARRVDDRERVVRPDRGGARVELAGVARAAALAHVVERDRVGGVAGRVDDDDRPQLRQPLADRDDLRHLLSVLAHDRDGLRVAGDPLALLG